MKAEKIILNIKKKIKFLGFFHTLRYYFYNFLKIKKLTKFKISKRDIYVRTSTPDLNVAIDSLEEEYINITDYINNNPNLIVDAGGYIGTSAIKLSEMFPESKIITLEPISENYKVLLKNIDNYTNIHPIKSALVSRNLGKISMRDRSTGEWGYTVVKKPSDQRNSRIIEEVNTITLVDIKNKFNLSINILKLDIEGGEKDIFENSKKEVNEIDAVIVELHDRITKNCSSSFKEACGDKIISKLGSEKFIATKK